MHKCTLCSKDFCTYGEFHAHQARRDCIEYMPINTSGRSKLQIVLQAEQTYLAPYIIGGSGLF